MPPVRPQVQVPPGFYPGQVPQPYGMPGVPPHMLLQQRPRTLRSVLWRNRRYWPAPAWTLTAMVTVAILRGHSAPILLCLAAGVVPGVLMVLATRRVKHEFLQHWWIAAGAAFTLLVPALGIAGPVPWLLFVFAAAVLGLTGALARYYRIRPEPEKAPPSSDVMTWRRLADHNKWDARLGQVEKIPNGVTYPITFDGITTHIGKVLPQPLAIAAAYRRPITEAYVEPSKDGDPSKARLVLLRNGTLEDVRHWDGTPATPEGFATIGRYADATPARIRLFVPKDGGRHSIIAGALGSGKTSLLDLLIMIYLASGIYPVILDPQNGQSLPHWRGRVPYAAGAEECMELLTLVHQGMMDRSRRLGQTEWQRHGRTVQGMGFFDSQLTGWPHVRVLADEHPVLLKDRQYGADATFITGEIGKLGRKAGVAEDIVCQVPSLSELQDQTVRSMLTACNVIGLRTGDRVSGNMLNLPADPCDLPRYFRNNEPTYGLGYIIGPDNRQVIGRTNMPSPEQMAADYELPVLEPEFASILARFGQPAPAGDTLITRILGDAGINGDNLMDAIEWAANNAAPNGKTAADAVLAVLDRPMTAGEVIRAAQDLSKQWGRHQPFDMKSIRNALRKLKDEGRITQAGERAPYAPAA